MKMMWETPKIEVQAFAANDAVSACYGLACVVGNGGTPTYGNHWSAPENGSGGHAAEGTSGTCGDVLANRIITDANGVITSIQENNAEQGWINGYLDYWEDVNENGRCDGGDAVYWYTTGSQNRRWNHWGWAVNVDDSHPNHS